MGNTVKSRPRTNDTFKPSEFKHKVDVATKKTTALQNGEGLLN